MKKYLVFCKYRCEDGPKFDRFCVLANDCYEAIMQVRAKPKKYPSANMTYNLILLDDKEASS